MTESREVWITGIGAVTAAGSGADAIERLLAAGTSALQPSPIAGGRPIGSAPAGPRDRAARRLDRSAALFHSACTEAWRDAGLADAPPSGRAGLIEGSSLGPMAGVLEDHLRVLEDPRERNRPTRLARFMTGAGGALFAQETGLRGPVYHLSAGSVSAACAIGEAFRQIRAGALDLVVAGGGECPLHPEIVATFAASGVLAPADDAAGCRPFDARRRGTALGEGAGALVLESPAHAGARGAEPLAIVRGFGFCVEEAASATAPDPEGAGVVSAIAEAGRDWPLARVAWVKAHGTGTRAGDAAEVAGLSRTFGDRLAQLPTVSLKSALGHCLGASAAVEAVAVVAALRCERLPGTVGFSDPDPEFPPCLIGAVPAPAPAGAVLMLAESFGGRCAALVLDPAG